MGLENLVSGDLSQHSGSGQHVFVSRTSGPFQKEREAPRTALCLPLGRWEQRRLFPGGGRHVICAPTGRPEGTAWNPLTQPGSQGRLPREGNI